ncbi:hypothetical protein T484DRAFT_2829866 [Baffinella frigidus]|nr:hypothetical protein T484DRAFT_2829866 [Cryptophyta sp. CCMP2293]
MVGARGEDGESAAPHRPPPDGDAPPRPHSRGRSVHSSRAGGLAMRRQAVTLSGMLGVALALGGIGLVGQAGAQSLCPGSLTQVCQSCPNTCAGTCSTTTNNVKCKGASWGNTNFTYMNISCATPPPLPREKYPTIPVQEALLSAPLACSGVVLKGLWPFDSDEMTFPIETMFRDPAFPLQAVNAEFLNCLSLSLKVTAVAANDDAVFPNPAERGNCLLTRENADAAAYTGLSLYVCIGTNVLTDTLCRNGEWIEVVHGTCVGERVYGGIELTQSGSRALLRVGGPSKLTGCQAKWEVSISRTNGQCSGRSNGLGNCCESACTRAGSRLHPTSCRCLCPEGFTGPECDVIAPHFRIQFTLFNRTDADWSIRQVSDITGAAAENQHVLITTLSEVLQVNLAGVEFGESSAVDNLGTGAGGTDPFYVSRPGPGRRAGGRAAEEGFAGMLEDSGEGWGGVRLLKRGAERSLLAETGTCREVAAGREEDVAGLGISKVTVRVRVLFETDLVLATARLNTALVNGTLEQALAANGVHVCVINAAVDSYNAVGFKMVNRRPSQPPSGLALADVLVILLGVVSVVVLLGFCFLEWYSGYVVELDRQRHLNHRKPVTSLLRYSLGWRMMDPKTETIESFHSKISKKIEDAYKYGFLSLGQATLKIVIEGDEYTVDFSQMRIFENSAGAKGVLVKVTLLPQPQSLNPKP